MGGIDEILEHLNKHGTISKDAQGEGRAKKQSKPLTRNRASTRQTIDLHGLTEDKAIVQLRNAVHAASRNGVSELLVIHGYGLHSDPVNGPVLKRMVGIMLENELAHHVKEYIPAPARDGGMGATLVRIKHRAHCH